MNGGDYGAAHGSDSQESFDRANAEMIRRGFLLIPIPLRAKAPIIPKWPLIRVTSQNYAEFFPQKMNVGALFGDETGIVDVDLDALEAIIAADFFLPSTPCTYGRTSRPRSHRLFRPAPLTLFDQFELPDGMLVEIRSTGVPKNGELGKAHQSVIPPSIHPSGEAYGWDQCGDPAAVTGADLRRAVVFVAVTAALAHLHPAFDEEHKQARNDYRLSVSGVLARNFHPETAKKIFRALLLGASDPKASDRIGLIADTYKNLSAGAPVPGIPSLQKILGAKAFDIIAPWIAEIAEVKTGVTWRPEYGTVADNDVWLTLVSLGDELPPVPSFDLSHLPRSFGPLIEDVAERTQTPPDLAAAAAVTALAGCVNRRALIRPKVEDDWTVVPNLWGANVAPPGFMKSPIARAITLPLNHVEGMWRIEYEQVIANFANEKERAELRWQAWREEFKRATKKGAPEPIEPDRTLLPPSQRRLVLTDATTEKLHSILAENPSGVFVFRDELVGWIAEIDKPGREGERGFYLQAWNGDSGFAVDRIGRGSIYVPNVCVSLFGNIQPARLRWYLAQMRNGGPSDDGLFQRIQIFAWPDAPQSWTLTDRAPNNRAIAIAERVFSTLANLSSDDPVRLRFAPDAQELFYAWLSELEEKVRGDKTHPALIAHFAKYRSLMPKLAGLFELSDRVAAGSLSDEKCEINLAHAEQSAMFCEYLEDHARRIYSCIVSPVMHAARELARHLEHNDLPSPFTTRAVYVKGWAGLDDPDRARGALYFLEEMGWLRKVEPAPPARSGGRQSEGWLINPQVVKHAK
jgi:putative DNA primase/helicase